MLRFVINLDSSPERLAGISERLNELGIPFERIPAINGLALSDEQVAALTYPLDHFESRIRFPRELSKGEIGCFLSHRMCWQRLLESKDDWALIMEDDIRISSLAPKYMLSADWVPRDVHVCQYSWSKAEQKGRILKEPLGIDDALQIVIPVFPSPMGCMCYLISRTFAEAAVRRSEKFAAPVDVFLFSRWFDLAREFIVWRTSPTLVTHNEKMHSVIGQRSGSSLKKAPFWIRHGLSRFLLGLQIKNHRKKGVDFTFVFKE